QQVGVIKFYLKKSDSFSQPISYKDSSEWKDTSVKVKVDEEGGDTINVATSASFSLSELNCGSLVSPYGSYILEATVLLHKIVGIA
ncbi:hypothetical protein S245_069978, partial [Arachis hypogaea]